MFPLNWVYETDAKKIRGSKRSRLEPKYQPFQFGPTRSRLQDSYIKVLLKKILMIVTDSVSKIVSPSLKSRSPQLKYVLAICKDIQQYVFRFEISVNDVFAVQKV